MVKKIKKITKDNMIERFIELNEKTTLFMDRITQVLEDLNHNNKLHKQAIEINTQATKEMTKSFSRIWYVFLIIVLALVVLAGAEKVLKVLTIINGSV